MSAANGIGTPPGWIEGKLADFVHPRGEKALPSSLPDATFLGMDHIEAHTTRIVGGVPASKMKSAGAKFYRGDVLYGRLRPYLNKVATPGFDGLASAEFLVFPDSQIMHSQFLKLRLNASDFVGFASHLNEGDRPRVDFDQIGEFPILLPPAAEQRRIVAKIEEMFSELDKGVESLTTAREQIKVYRQSVLKAAFDGRLTEDWRSKNSEHLESGEILVAQIKGEREQRYENELAEWRKEARSAERDGRPKPRKPSKPTAPARPSPQQVSSMGSIPSVWTWLQLADFAFVTKLAGFEYTKFVRYDDDGDLEVIKAENAGPNGFRETAFSKIRSDTVSALERSRLVGGELLMVFVGAGTGNVAIVPKGRSFFLGPNIGMMRVTSEHVNPFYVEQFLRSPQGRELVLSSVKAVAQPSLSMGTIRQIPVALPSLAEQVEIIRIIGSKLEAAGVMEAEIDAGLARAEALRHAILKRAFSGQLVPQDTTDEPASSLLERIRAEREGSVFAQTRSNKNNRKKEVA